MVRFPAPYLWLTRVPSVPLALLVGGLKLIAPVSGIHAGVVGIHSVWWLGCRYRILLEFQDECCLWDSSEPAPIRCDDFTALLAMRANFKEEGLGDRVRFLPSRWKAGTFFHRGGAIWAPRFLAQLVDGSGKLIFQDRRAHEQGRYGLKRLRQM